MFLIFFQSLLCVRILTHALYHVCMASRIQRDNVTIVHDQLLEMPYLSVRTHYKRKNEF